MEKIDFLPLGSVVVIKGSIKKFMIVSRALNVNVGDTVKFFDYGGCFFPEGLMGDKLMYFQHEDIMKLVFKGYDDDDNKMMIENINNVLAESSFERADVKKLKEGTENKNDGS